MNFRAKTLICTAISSFMFSWSSFARAEAIDAASLPPSAPTGSDASSNADIVVTATKTEVNVSKVPISISAYSKSRLDNLGVRTVADIAALTPGVDLQQIRARATGTNISIRGISSLIGAGTTGIYIDDAPIQVRIIGYDANNVYPQIFDLDRVEVLRGPQGTLFGSGSMGGTVRFITPQPSLSGTSVYARSEIATTEHGDPSYEGGVAVGTPIIEDHLAVRMSAWYRRDGGWVDRANGFSGVTTAHDINSQTSKVFRGSILWSPISNLRITPSIYYQDLQVADSGAFWTTLSNPSDGVFRTGLPRAQPVRDRFSLPSLKLDYDLGDVTLTSSTAYLNRTANNSWDYSTVVPAILSANRFLQVPGYQASSVFIDKQRNFTQELRAQGAIFGGRLTWVTGLFYEHLKQSGVQSIDAQYIDVLSQAIYGAPAQSIFGPNANAGDLGPSALYIVTQSVDTQYAAFGEASLELLRGLKLTAGLRYSHTKLEFADAQAGPFNGPSSDVRNQTKANPLTPRFSLSYQIDPRTMVYATASKGFRIGGGNASLPSTTCAAELKAIGIPNAPETYKSDSLWNYEAGAKTKLFGDVLQLNGSAFYIKWKNIQQQVFLKCAFQYVDNVGGATSKGFDLQAQLHPIAGLTLGSNIGYVRARYTSNAYPGPVPGSGPKSVIVTDGDSLGVHPWTVTGTADYERSIGTDRTLYANVTVEYHSHEKGRTANLDPDSVSYDPALPPSPASTLVNMRVGARLKGVDVSAFVKNLTDTTVWLSRNHDTVGNPILQDTTFQPRTVGLTVSYRY
jgi:iron complex outermembrane recepter protein